MKRARNAKGRFVKGGRRRKATRKLHRSRRRRHSLRRRMNPVMATRRRRRSSRRKSYRRRRHNPGLMRGVPLPNFANALTIAGGGIGSKFIGKMIFPQGAAMFGGWGGPLTTLGVGIGLGFVAKMMKMGKFAAPIVTGAAVVAAIDAATKQFPQLGVYVSPGDVNVAGSGVGYFPPGFMEPTLSAGNENAPWGFQHEYSSDIY